MQLSGVNSMIITVEDLLLKYSDYTDARGKIRRDILNGKIYPIVRGIYETDKTVSGMFLAGYIYGPSYISFDYALAYYGLIPERVDVFSSATYNKHKIKKYSNYFGDYIYRDVPNDVFCYGIVNIEQNGYLCNMASAEKALCDKLYTLPPIKSIKALKLLLFEDMRIEEENFHSLNVSNFEELCPKYKSNNLNFLLKLVRSNRGKNN